MRRSLAACTAEGMVVEVVTACSGATALTAWGLYVDASPLLLGVLWGLPFFGQILQVPAAWLTTRFGRRQLAIVGHGVARQLLLLLAALPFLPMSMSTRRAALTVVFSISALLGVLGHNAWLTWMGDLVPARIRGRYFGRRTALCMFLGALSSMAVGAVMDAGRARGATGPTLAALSVVASLGGAVAGWLMRQQHEPKAIEPAPFSPRELAAPLAHPPSRRLLVYQVVWNASIGVTASLCALHLVEALHVGFAGMALYTAVLAGMRVIATPLWGRALDRVGARPVLVLCSFGAALSSALWLLSGPGALWPIALDAALSGALLSGLELAVFAGQLAIAPAASRPYYLAAFVSAAGLSFGLASVAGGALVARLGTDALFAVASCGRLAAALLALRLLEPGAQPVIELLRRAARRRTRTAEVHVTASIEPG